MFYLKTEHSFDSAHFLSGYEGKCGNIHGHRWRVIIEVKSHELEKDKQLRGMVVDFATLKRDIKEEVDYFDHALIVEKNSMKPSTLAALEDEGFHLVEVNFRTTAEMMAKYFYDRMSEKGYKVKMATVYETPNNCASFGEE